MRGVVCERVCCVVYGRVWCAVEGVACDCTRCADLESEVTEMKSKARTEVKGDLVGLLRQALLEEQLLSKDLKRKLQSVKSMNASLSEQLQEARQSPDTLLVNLSISLSLSLSHTS